MIYFFSGAAIHGRLLASPFSEGAFVSLQRRLFTAERRVPMLIVDLINVLSFSWACIGIGFSIGYAIENKQKNNRHPSK